MVVLLTLSLLLNILVLVPVCGGLFRHARWTLHAFGADTPARGILLSVYVAILLASVALLIVPSRMAIATLLALQILYKLTTPFTVGTLRNPVVISNLAIAAFHGMTLALA